MQTILIVDDDSQVTEQLAIVLDSIGYDTQFLLEPAYLLPMLQKKRIDLILLDIHMPGVDGLSLLKELKTHPDYESIPVIMLTGDTDEKILAECFLAGAVDFIHKPVREVVLQARVKSALAIQEQMKNVVTANRLLKKTFDGMLEAVITLDQHFHVQLLSDKACKMLNIQEASAVGKPAVSILGSQVAGPAGELMVSFKTVEPRFDVPTHVLSRAGKKIPISLSVLPLEEDDCPTGWLLLFRDLRKEERFLREQAHSITFGRMISCDSKMNEIFKLIEKIAVSSAAVLIKGESGSGKELAAREIHDRSRFAQGPFHAVNCASISPHLLESEFFGHEQGAFTGASRTKKGRFELANQGTLFLDEIGDIPLELQGKLLRVLQEQEFERVGGTKTIRIQLRVIAATNRDLVSTCNINR